jgi:hypothetical protein
VTEAQGPLQRGQQFESVWRAWRWDHVSLERAHLEAIQLLDQNRDRVRNPVEQRGEDLDRNGGRNVESQSVGTGRATRRGSREGVLTSGFSTTRWFPTDFRISLSFQACVRGRITSRNIDLGESERKRNVPSNGTPGGRRARARTEDGGTHDPVGFFNPRTSME